MNELIHISEYDGQQAVDARELHTFLESKRQFGNWIQYRIKGYGFVEGVDYSVFNNIVKNPTGGRTRKEYALTLSCAKELAMVEGNKKGKAARLYFIECERRLQASSLQQCVSTLEIQVADLQRQLVTSRPKATQPKALPLVHEAILVQKHFAPAPVGGTQFWTVEQVIDFLKQAEQVKTLNRYRVGTALSRICGPRFCKSVNNKTQSAYWVTLSA